MHIENMHEEEGTFTKKEWEEIPGTCRKCGQRKLVCRVWESSCGGYEDNKIKCSNCGHIWWVDGIDS